MRILLFFTCLIFPALCLAKEDYAGPKPTIRGEWVQGGILFGKTEPGTEVEFMGIKVPATLEGEFVIGLGRDAEPQAELATVNAKGVKQTFFYDIQKREYNIQRIEGVKQKHVTPPQSVLERISKEAAQVREARALVDDRADYLEEFVWPLRGAITGVYGSQRVYNGVPKSPHYGIDIAGPTGAPVIAPAPGLVSFAAADLYYSGGTLIVDHGHGLSSTFIHLNKVLVKAGQRVEKGQIIAEVGASGRATGPHLDWRMNWMGVRVDPGLLMKNKPMEPNNAR